MKRGKYIRTPEINKKSSETRIKRKLSVGENNPNFKNAKKIYKCVYCSKEITDYVNSEKYRTNHFCDRKCYEEYRKKFGRKPHFCIDCGKKNSYGAPRCRDCYIQYEKKQIKPKIIHYCIDPTCNKEVSGPDKRCISCVIKGKSLKERGHKDNCQCAWCKTRRGECKGENSPLFGKHLTKEIIKKMSLAKGGTGIPYEHTDHGPDFTEALKEVVRRRDHYTCQLCGCPQIENGRKLDVHHIDYNKLQNILKNLIALCIACHAKTRVKREKWKRYFINLLLKEYHYVY